MSEPALDPVSEQLRRDFASEPRTDEAPMNGAPALPSPDIGAERPQEAPLPDPGDAGFVEVPAPDEDLSLAEVLARELPPQRWIVPDLIAPSTISYLHGLPETFKSFIGLNIGLAVARAVNDPGVLALGKLPVEQAGPVGYIWQDDSEVEEMRRIQVVARAVDAEAEAPMFFMLNRGLRVDTAEGLGRLRRWIEHRKPVLVVLDSLKDFVTDGSTKDDAWVMRANNSLKAICDELGVALLILHHDSKPHGDTKGRSAGQTMHGSVFMEAGARSGLHCARPDAMKPEVRIARWGNSGKHWGPDVLRLDEETCELELVEVAGNVPKVGQEEYLAAVRESDGGLFVADLAEQLGVTMPTALAHLKKLPGVAIGKRRKGSGSEANFAHLGGEQDALL